MHGQHSSLVYLKWEGSASQMSIPARWLVERRAFVYDDDDDDEEEGGGGDIESNSDDVFL